ncbi:DNA phosphorothioation-dependent restriction protein DptG [Lederbergia citrea]|uniref:DNA phosphorothioation-dependent restriction protein DptG n=1 Tax=Lederbergia citrea TaxID=2833581 RepID=UPI001BC986BE|nr:DNA phosphorothioation-dependent restriction protein DptG [Lederbergia citrea]MBS4205480.1 DNA phosphorothioation-dependent restriction protein DptG [Lederbergia citrea]
MIQTLNRQYLKDLLHQKNKHDTGDVIEVLPFLSKRTRAVRGQFNKILGEFVRNICCLQLNNSNLKNKDDLSYEGNELSELIASTIEYENQDDMYDFKRFLDAHLFNEDKINPIHPYLYNYIELEKNLKNEFGKYAVFMNETFVNDNEEIKTVFNNQESEDILTEVILTKLDALKPKKPLKEQQYEPLLPSLSKLFQEDLVYLSKHKDYFLTSFPLITHYYVFMYACQLIFKFEQFTSADFNEIQPLYFGLDGESLNKRRNAADGVENFKYIKEKSENLFPHIHTISQLNHNSIHQNNLKEEEQTLPFIPYGELYSLIKEQGEEYEKNFLVELKQWIKDYSTWAKVNVVDNSTNIPEAFEVLHSCLTKGMSQGVIEKYGGNIEDLGANQFIKSRGSLGQVFNLKQDFLLILTAVSVKDKRIPLNDLFIEFEKRGVALDMHSKKEVITLFNNLNIIDKKSDSGDAQYVKPIL